MGWIFQLDPFQASANVAEPEAESPTAVHVVPDEHFTPARIPPWFGTDWIFHAVPFQRSASTPARVVVVLVVMLPTAVQALADVHDTPRRFVTSVPAGMGVGWIFQLLPFHRSANATDPEKPTAVQALADVHDTPSRRLFVAPLGLGVGWMTQPVPVLAGTAPQIPAQARTTRKTTRRRAILPPP